MYYYCARCQSPLVPNSRICERCGEVFDIPVPPPAQTIDPSMPRSVVYWPPNRPQPGVSKDYQTMAQAVGSLSTGTKLAAIGVLIFIVLIAAIVNLSAHKTMGDANSVRTPAPPVTRPIPQPMPVAQVPVRPPESVTIRPVVSAPPTQVPLMGDLSIEPRPQQDPNTGLPNMPPSLDQIAYVQTLVITNRTNYQWNNLHIAINPGPTAFYANCAGVFPGQEATVELDWFAASSGLRFDSNTMKVMRVEITAGTPNGPGFGGWNFN